MSRISSSGAPSESTGPVLEAAVADLLFKPTPRERNWKARLWVRLADNPMLDASMVTADDAVDLCGSTDVRRQWSKPGFREWLLNQDEHRERLEYLFGLALDAAEDILLNTDPKAQSARVNVIKVLSELAGKFPRNQPAKSGLERAIEGMDRAALGLYLEKQGVGMTVQATKQVTLPGDTDK
jgi:hypothetical protein